MFRFSQSVVSFSCKRGLAIALGAGLSLFTISPAQAAAFRLSWTGQILGYSAEGNFRYDDTQTRKILQDGFSDEPNGIDLGKKITLLDAAG